MSKQDDYPARLSLYLSLLPKESEIFEKALRDSIGPSDRIVTNIRHKDEDLMVDIKAKEINLLQAVMNNYFNSIKMLGGLNKL
jgi:tRNA threonylcarbamoyladenosine modification (KEOPS) complex  Pcc1 subunit